MGAACQRVRRLVPRLWHECGLRVSPRTLKRALRRAGYGWKRTRRSLKRPRDPAAFAACRQQLAVLHRAEQAGQLAIYYVDEVRFSRQAPVPCAWQVRGQPCACRPAERGAGGHSVLRFWRPADSQATGRQAFAAIVSATAFTAELLGLAVDEFVAHLSESTVLVLDNASIHKAHLVKTQMAAWAAAGLTPIHLYWPYR